jgi:asparagine synthase (glutamine-hydrolysing)
LIHEQRQRAGAGESVAPEMNALREFHHTFTACWPGWSADEEPQVDALCAQLNLSSHKLYPTAAQVADALPAIVYSLDEPFETPTAVAQYLLMRQARAAGVKVVLNGHGSDEALAGYAQAFVPPLLAGLLLSGRWSHYLSERRAFSVVERWGRGTVARQVLLALMPVALKRHAQAISRWLRRRESSMAIFADGGGVDEEVDDDLRGLSPLNEALARALTRTILPMWLRMEDRVSMACSVESRLPFMDYRLVEFAFALPDSLKLRDGYTKYILRRTMWDRLPQRIVSQRAKQRFATPFDDWFRGAWRRMIEDLLLSGSCKVEPYLRLNKFRPRLQSFLGGRSDVLGAGMLWRILNTELWMRAFG